MSDDISQLIGRLRSYARSSKGDIFAAVDTIEALLEERDRLKAALETIAEGRDSGRHDGLPEEHPAHSAVLMHYIACEALEAKE